MILIKINVQCSHLLNSNVHVCRVFQTREAVVTKKRKVAHQDEKHKTKQQKVESGDLKLNTAPTVEILHLRVCICT